MFVLLLGLLGVAAMLPVGSHYVKRGEEFDRGSAVGQAALGETVARGLLNKDRWVRITQFNNNALPTMQPVTAIIDNAFSMNDLTLIPDAYVIDPLGIFEMGRYLAETSILNLDRLWVFPADAPLNETPFRRVSLPEVAYLSTARNIFQSRDELTFIVPEADDESSRLLFETDGNLQAVRRQTGGDFSWLITVAPEYDFNETLNRMLPVTGDRPDVQHTVSFVVFHNRDFVMHQPGTDSAYNERQVLADILSPGFGGGEVRLRTVTTDEELLHKFEGVRTHEWLLLYGPENSNLPPTMWRWFTAWYEIVSIDEEVEGQTERFVSLRGPDWPWAQATTVRAGLFGGAIAVFTQSMQLETNTSWTPPVNVAEMGMPRQP